MENENDIFTDKEFDQIMIDYMVGQMMDRHNQFWYRLRTDYLFALLNPEE